HEQGYVPRRTVLFAAWDAEEMGLLGARHYVAHPSYPLESTVAMLQLDMVGAGRDLLFIDGDERLGAALAETARALGVESALSRDGRSDHVPFWEAGIPASLLIWDTDTSETPTYHRPLDTVETIDLDNVRMAGRIAGTAALALADGELGVRDMLAARASAAAQGDLASFLATSTEQQRADDERWFVDLQSAGALSVTLEARELHVLGSRAAALVEMRAVCGDGSTQERTLLGSLRAQFVHVDGSWKWNGPDLLAASPVGGEAIQIRYPESLEAELAGLGSSAAARMSEIAAQVGLSVPSDVRLLIMPSTQALQASVGLAAELEDNAWVVPGSIMLSYSPAISGSEQLDEALVRLLLVEAGLTETSAPLLWQELSSVVRTEHGLQEPPSLASIQDALAAAKPAGEDPALRWAALAYLIEKLGWHGVGELIADVGRAAQGGPGGVDTFDAALRNALGVDHAGFEVAWREHWQAQIGAMQGALDNLLAARVDAVRAGDVAAFLSTVDPSVPGLLAQEERWVRDLVASGGAIAMLEGRPLALDTDGRLKALVSVVLCSSAAEECDAAEGERVSTVWVRQVGDRYQWSGALPGRLSVGGDHVLYGRTLQEEAQSLLQEAKRIRATLSTRLALPADAPLTLSLYDQEQAYRAALPPSVAAAQTGSAWVAPDGAIHLRATAGADAADLAQRLAPCVARALLGRVGQASEWLLVGGSIYASQYVDGGATAREVERGLDELLDAVEDGAVQDLREIGDLDLAPTEAVLAQTQAWDAVRYLVYTHGPESLLALIAAQGRGADLDQALREVTGQSLAAFSAAWQDSLARGHSVDAWAHVATGFDEHRALDHVEALTSPEMGGRQTGSTGAARAAEYVARRFEEYGLAPALPGPGSDGFMQGFPISYTALTEAPQLELAGPGGDLLDALTYREDFVTLLHILPTGGRAEGEVVWVRDAHYAGIDLGGKIALRVPSLDVTEEVSRAVAHGAGGLLLVGRTAGQQAPTAKYALPVVQLDGAPIPVLELTRQGYDRLLDASGHTRDAMLGGPPALPVGLVARMAVPLEAPQIVEAANILGLLRGRDPLLAEEVVVLVAHYDHVGDDPAGWICPPGISAMTDERASLCERAPGRRYPGANDNASGIAVLLEIARTWQEAGYKPRRSVLFAAWGAHEPGQVGLAQYAAHPVWPLERTAAVLHLDAVGGGAGYYLGAQADKLNDALLRFTIARAEELVDGRLSLSSAPARHDPAAVWRDAGIPTLYLTWREASKEHWPTEYADLVEPYRLGVTGKMVALTLMMLAR
ncbi:MAG: M28 family peptidase, partial [Anaerolineae bacterium]|nr:M28 family peptidase [Anaerolineae bacterium]